MDGGKVNKKTPNIENHELVVGGLHHDGLRAEDEEVLRAEGGEDQVRPKQDLASFQDTSLCQTGDNLFILIITLSVIMAILMVILTIVILIVINIPIVIT